MCSRRVAAVASAPLNSRNSVTVTANSTIWKKRQREENEIWPKPKPAQDDFNVNGIFWHYCVCCTVLLSMGKSKEGEDFIFKLMMALFKSFPSQKRTIYRP